MDSGNQKSAFVARNVPAPISTASAHARNRPMRNRSAAEPPLTMAPDSPLASGTATTPSTDSTKFATTHSGGSEKDVELRKGLHGALRDARSGSVSILVVGHYCHDTLFGNAGTHRTVGGTAAYASAILEALGESHEVVAKVGEDFL